MALEGASLVNLEDYVKNITPIKNHFEKLKDTRDDILKIDSSLVRHIYSNAQLYDSLNKNYQLLVVPDVIYPILFKSNGEIQPIVNYESRHLRNSVVKSLLVQENVTMLIKMNNLTYVLYYYSFFKCPNPIDISLNVITDMENIIRMIIDKDLTLYRNVNTRELLYCLDWKLREEKMTKAAYAINLRR